MFIVQVFFFSLVTGSLMIYRIMNQAVILSNPSSHSASKTNYIFKAISMVDNFFPQYKADQQFMTT